MLLRRTVHKMYDIKHPADNSLQGFKVEEVWTPEYVEQLKGFRTDGYNKAYTKPLSDRSNKYLLDCKNVLDVGCGWMPYTPDDRYTGLDVSEAMLVKARQIHPETTFIHASAYELPFSDKHFEGIRSTGMLRHMKNWKPALAEMTRVGSKKLTFTHLIGAGNARCGRYQWHTTLKDICEMLPNYPTVSVIKSWPTFESVLFMVSLEK